MDFEKAEYEIQHFGFSVDQLKYERRHLLKGTLKSRLDKLANFLATKINLPESKHNELLAKSKEIADEMFKCLEATLSQIESLDEKHFVIPPNVVLADDFRYLRDYRENDEEHLTEIVENMRLKFKQNVVMISALEDENTKYESISAIVEEELRVADKVKQTLGAINVEKCKDLVEHVESTYDKVKEIL